LGRDFDYVDGKLERHDFGDLRQGEMHERLIGYFSEQAEKSKTIILPTVTLQITPTRFRVSDLVLFDMSIPRKEITKTSVPACEVLSPEDTMMRVADLVSDYLAKGVAHVWIVDPRTRSGWDRRQAARCALTSSLSMACQSKSSWQICGSRAAGLDSRRSQDRSKPSGKSSSEPPSALPED
jgi:hypothetical protein